MCVCSLEGKASFDFLLITQHALCSVVNCPGPLLSHLGEKKCWNGEEKKLFSLSSFSVSPLLPSSLQFSPPSFMSLVVVLLFFLSVSVWMQMKHLVARTGPAV